MLLTILGVLIATYLFILITKEFLSYRSLTFYTKQGAKAIYLPIAGFSQLTTKGKDGDPTSQLQDLQKNFNDEKMLVMNQFSRTSAFIYPMNNDLIKEILLNELTFLKRYADPVQLKRGFFHDSGKDHTKKRVIFSTFFNQKNMTEIAPKFFEIAQQKITEMKENLWQVSADQENKKNQEGDNLVDNGKGEWKKVSLTKMLDSIFSEIGSVLLLGEKHTIDGRVLSELLHETRNMISDSSQTYLNILSFNKLHEYGLLPESFSIKRQRSRLEAKCLEVFNLRKEQGPKDLPNILDVIIKEAEEGEWSREDIIGNMNLFQLAGTENNKHTLKNFINHLSSDSELQKELRACAKSLGIYNQNSDNFQNLEEIDFDGSPELDSIVKEVFRLYTSAITTGSRIVYKNKKIGGFNFRKGDLILVPL